jgi:hypothetical protein
MRGLFCCGRCLSEVRENSGGVASHTVFCADGAITSVHFFCALWRQSILEGYFVADCAAVAVCLVGCWSHVRAT